MKQLICNHRLILSGTPIQNNVLELWSLFDFLMPGFLGTEKQFQARYGRPILQSRDAKSSSKEQEAGNFILDENNLFKTNRQRKNNTKIFYILDFFGTPQICGICCLDLE